MDTYPYIAIEGAIGAGKTTLARMLAEDLSGETLLEVFEENPFLGDFYADRARYAFQTQVFFLLSRYRQQHGVIARTLTSSLLVSDYLFAKDWLFAHLNLHGDELSLYERVHAILGEQIPPADLVVYLRADTETLMRRIAFRDRPYERQMSRSYIDSLRQAYEQYFQTYAVSPVLVLDTVGLDIVGDSGARSDVVRQVRNALETPSYQPPLPEIGSVMGQNGLPSGRRPWPGGAAWTAAPRSNPPAGSDLILAYMGLSGQIGRLGELIGRMMVEQQQAFAAVGNRQEAADIALEKLRTELQDQLTASLEFLLEIASDARINLDRARAQAHRREPGAG